MTRMVFSFLLTLNIYATPTELGNGNDGGDLVEFREIKEGPIYDTRKMAVKQLSQINLRGIQGLGYLKDEVEKTKLYITKDGLTAKDLLELGAFKEGSSPIVYARTFPRPHAATRFFPAATSLTKAQLVAVHIHEGLHRSLPVEIRSDESIVEEITKVITSPNSTFEDIIYVMNSKLPTPVLINKVAEVEPITTETTVTLNLPRIAKSTGYFKNSRLKVTKEVYNQENLYLWNDANIISPEVDLYTWDSAKLIFKGSIYNFRDIDGNYSDRSYGLGLRLEKDANDAKWGAEFSTANSGIRSYGNPLARSVTTAKVDWQKNIKSYDIKVGFRYTSSGEYVVGSIDTFQNPDLELKDEQGYDTYSIAGQKSYFDETEFGSILTLDLEVNKDFDNGISMTSGLSFHDMSFYSTTNTESYFRDGSSFESYRGITFVEEDFPVLATLNLGVSYQRKSLTATLNYMKLLNSLSGSSDYTLTNLGDPTGRGLGDSSLSLSLELSI